MRVLPAELAAVSVAEQLEEILGGLVAVLVVEPSAALVARLVMASLAAEVLPAELAVEPLVAQPEEPSAALVEVWLEEQVGEWLEQLAVEPLVEPEQELVDWQWVRLAH